MFIPKKSLATSFMVLMLSVFAFGAVYFLKFQTKYKSSASSPDSPPINVAISNPSASSFTISWLTLVPTTGKVFYGTDSNATNIKLVAGDSTISTVHLINLENLNPETKYFFLLCSGDDCAPFKLYGLKPGVNVLGKQIARGISSPRTTPIIIPDEVTSAPIEMIASPTAVISENNSNVQQGTSLPISFQTLKKTDLASAAFPVFGSVKGDVASNSALLVFSVTGQSGESFPMTSVADTATGNFSLEASNAKKIDLSGEFVLNKDDILKIKAYRVFNGQIVKTEKTMSMTDISPIKAAISF